MDFKGYRQALEQIDEECSKDKRWKIAYGDVVYITDEQQKLVITTYQIRPHRHPLADLPPWSSGPHDPPFFLKSGPI